MVPSIAMYHKQLNNSHLFTCSFNSQNSSIWSTDVTLSGATTLGQSGPESNVNEEVVHIP